MLRLAACRKKCHKGRIRHNTSSSNNNSNSSREPKRRHRLSRMVKQHTQVTELSRNRSGRMVCQIPRHEVRRCIVAAFLLVDERSEAWIP